MTKIKSKILFLFLLILFGFINQQKVYSCSEYYVGEAYITEYCSSYCSVCESCGCTCDNWYNPGGGSPDDPDDPDDPDNPDDPSTPSTPSTPQYYCSCGASVSSSGETCGTCKAEALDNQKDKTKEAEKDLENLDKETNPLLEGEPRVNGAEGEAEKTQAEQEEEEKKQKEQEEQEKEQAKENTKKDEQGKKSTTTGDPIRITNGEFVQTETDFSTKNFTINRIYTSFNKSVGSFGEGFFTILDEGIIRGLDIKIDEKITLHKNHIQELDSQKINLISIIKTTYNTDNYKNAMSILNDKISECETLKNHFYDLLENAEEIKQLISDSYLIFEAAENYQKIQNKIQEITNLQNRLYFNKNILTKTLEEIEKIESNILLKNNELAFLYEQKSINQQIKYTNTRSNFENLPREYFEGGKNTLILIEGNSGIKRFILESETEKNWILLNEDNSLNYKEKISETENGYIYYQKNGEIKTYNANGFLIEIQDVNGNKITFSRQENNQIIDILTPENQKYKVYYNAKGLISNIQHENTGKQYKYFYENNKLKKVISPENLTYEYIYNSENGLLAKFIKPDGSYTAYFHEEKDKNQNILTTSTENEEGFRENFDFYPDEKITIYTNHDGEQTVYYFDENGKTTKITDSSGNVQENEYDSKGNIISQTNNNILTKLFYDDNQNLIKQEITDYNDKTSTVITTRYQYDNFGNITKYVDGDGIVYDYVRDSRGNLKNYKVNNVNLISFDYDESGLVTKITELIDETTGNYKITEYLYDENQNKIQEKSGNRQVDYEYDEENRVVKSYLNGNLETEIFYTDFTTKIKQKNGLEVLYEYNNRFDLVKKTETDTILNQCHTTNYKYDARHLLVEEKIDFEKTQYRYSAFGTEEGILKTSEKSNQGFYVFTKKTGSKQTQTEGVFEVNKIKEKYPRLLEKPFYQWSEAEMEQFEENATSKKSSLQEYIASENAILVKDPLEREIVYKYNFQNQLESLSNLGDGTETQTISYNYTKAGRIESVKNQFDGKTFYKYTDFGTPSVVKNSYGTETLIYTKSGLLKKEIDGEGFERIYTYNNQGLLESVKSYNKNIYYVYDSENQLVQEIYGESDNIEKSLAFTEMEYSENNRKISINYGNEVFSEIILDGFGNVISEIDGEGNKTKYEYNSQNQVVAFYDGYENKTEYSYNPVGLLEKITFPDGSFEKYTYNESGLLIKVKNPLGISVFYEYDSGNRLVKEKTLAQEEKTYEYDSFDRLKQVKIGNVITESYEYFENGKKVIFKDGETQQTDGKLTQNLDDFGQLTEEINSFGIKQNYFYNKSGDFTSKIDGNNVQRTFTKRINSLGYEEITEYSDGSKKILTYDKVGRILEEKSLQSNVNYQYNKGNLLILQTDLQTGETTEFSYDKAGRKIRVQNKNQKVEYTYGKNSEILAIKDSQNDVNLAFTYDKLGREITKTYGNGNKEYTGYDLAGRVLYRYLRDSQKNILFSEGYYYDKNGFIRGKINHQGKITLYDYDEMGRLRVVYSSLDKDLENSQKTEIKENGGKILENVELNGTAKYLTYEEISNFQKILNEIQMGRGNIVTSINTFNVEIYNYDKSGNRISKENPFGKILYKYDSENRLIGSKAFGAFVENDCFYINFEYDNNGNLIKETSPQKEVYYSYNNDNRIKSLLIFDHLNKTKTEEYYEYDCFGRRIYATQNDTTTAYQYEGFGFNILYENSYKEARGALKTGFGEESVYAVKAGFGEEGLNALKGADLETTYRYRYIEESQNSQKQENKSYIYKDGNLVALTAGTSKAYYSSDIHGSTRQVSDTSGFSESYNYDSFGKPIYKSNYVDYEEGYDLDALFGENTDWQQIDTENTSKNDYRFSSWYQTRTTNVSPYASQYHDYLSVAGYSGKSYNSNTGLNNYGFRDYSSSIGRFITSDPIRDGTNWYTLAVNNPINFVDLWGLLSFDSTGFYDGIVYGPVDFVCTVTVTVLRQNDEYSNSFDSLRTVNIKNNCGIDITYNEFIGANAANKDYEEKYDGMTLPDGKYYLSTDSYLLSEQQDGTYDSRSYENVLLLKTNDSTISLEIRNEINDQGSGYFCHANQKKGNKTPYSTTPLGAGCNISQGQTNQNNFVSLVSLAPRLEAVNYNIISISNMEKNK